MDVRVAMPQVLSLWSCHLLTGNIAGGNTGGGGGVTDLVMSSYLKLSMDQATGLVQSKMQAKDPNMAVTVT